MRREDLGANLEILRESGIYNLRAAHHNLSPGRLVEEAVRRGEGILTRRGALSSFTGKRTGRSPGDKFTVDCPEIHDQIWWGSVNKPFSVEGYQRLKAKALAFMQDREIFIFDGYAGADPLYRVPIRVINLHAWQNLFAHQLFLRPKAGEAAPKPEFTVIHVPELLADPAQDGTSSETFILVNIPEKTILIGGTQYAGEIKKSIFGMLNYVLPGRDVLPMHCSANIGADGDVALFFGLSGTGKTTLSADPARRLIGDDEHGWSDHGVFNFEGGCYAKCIRLSEEGEPQIWNSIRFGAVLENVTVDPVTRVPDYDDESVTENTRAAYPVEFIPGAVESGMGGHPQNVVFLTADASGVLPPVAKLTPEQAMYHFLSGYTSKLAGTEAGVGKEPQPDFSACFGAPFLPLPPGVYADMLGKRLREHGTDCYLVNTGWTGGPYGVGSRMKLSLTRAIISAVLDGSLAQAPYTEDPIFGLHVPDTCPGVPSDVLKPKNTWPDKAAYDIAARNLADSFHKNHARFESMSEEIIIKGSPVSGR